MAHHSTFRRLVAATVGALALAPAAASAATLTVDDDLLDCPSAGYTGVQAAVNAASPGDTVAICPGTYVEGPATVPAGGANAVNIQKAITIKGAGPSKVLIKPRADLTSLLGTTTSYRNGTGAVLGVNRNGVRTTVDISGVSVDGGTTAVGAAVKFWNSEGSFTGSVVQNVAPLTAAQGYGVVIASNLSGDRLPVRVAGVSISGYAKAGVVLDSTQPAPMAGVLAPTITANTITGVGSQGITAQQGVLATGLVSGSVTANAISGNRLDDGDPATTTDDRASAGVRAVDLDLAPASATSTSSKLTVTGNNITGNGYGAINETGAGVDRVTAGGTVTNLTATGNWWGNAGGPSIGLPRTLGDPVNGATPGPAAGQTQAVNYSGFRTTPVTFATAVPSAITDAPPMGTIDPPTLSGTVVPGVAYSLAATAADDFGVKAVAFKADGVALGTDAVAPYVAPATWTPSAALEGQTVVLSVDITDSAGQLTTRTLSVLVKTPPAPPVPPVDPPPTDVPVVPAPVPSGPAPSTPAAVAKPVPQPLAGISRVARTARKRSLTVTGRVTPPRSLACPPGAQVTLSVYLGGRRVQHVLAKLAADCTYRLKVTAPARTAGRRVVLRIKVARTATTLARSAKALTVKVRR